MTRIREEEDCDVIMNVGKLTQAQTALRFLLPIFSMCCHTLDSLVRLLAIVVQLSRGD